MIRAIIVDDEWLARKRLETLLAAYEQIRVVASCRNGAEALENIQLKEPDLVFMDIQMPDIDGLTVVKQLDLPTPPAIIFTTAFDEYAIQAFEVEAIDYLLKPFDEDRLKVALDRVLQRLDLLRTAGFQQQLMQLVETHQQQLKEEELLYLEIKEKGRSIRVSIDDIYYFQSAGNYIALHTTQRKYLYRISMNALAEQLPAHTFLRIHRSYLLNTKYIAAHRYLNNNEFEFTLKNGVRLLSSKSYKPTILTYLNTHS